MQYSDESIKRSTSLPVSALAEFMGDLAEAERPIVRRLSDLMDMHHLDEARILYAQHPNLENWLYTSAVSLQHQCNYDKALSLYRHALHLNPSNSKVRNAYGSLFHKQGLLQQALREYQAVLLQDSQYVPTRLNLARLYLQTGNWRHSQSLCQEVLRHESENLHALEILVKISMMMCDWCQWDALVQRLWAAAEKCIIAGEHCNLSLLDLYALPWRAQQQQLLVRNHAHALAEKMAKPRMKLSFASRYANRKPTRRIRIAYLSPDFRNHPLGNLMWRLLELHNRKEFDVYAYSQGPDDGSEYRRKFAGDADVFRDVSGVSVNEAACQIYADSIDILVDVGGYTGFARPEILALRPAPVQVMYLGFPGNTGGAFIDYFVTDSMLTPPYLEKMMEEACVFLPPSSQIANNQQALADGEANRATWGLPEESFVFCSFNRANKIEPRVFGVWMRILSQVADSVLWLLPTHPQTVANLRGQARALGVDPKRLIFAPQQPLSKAEYLAQQSCADLFLDTLYFNGHVSTSNALWAGVPVVSCTGDSYMSRMGASLLHGVGLDHLVARDLAEYERIAVQLANHPEELRQIRNYLTGKRIDLPLFDSQHSVQNLEKAYQTMWRHHQQGDAPARIVISPDDKH